MREDLCCRFCRQADPHRLEEPPKLKPVLIAGLPPEDQVARDDVTQSASGKRIGGEMSLQSDARESHGGGKSIGKPTMPCRMRITLRKGRGHGHYGDLMPRRHAAEAADPPAGFPASHFEPAIREITSGGIGNGSLPPIDVFHHHGQDFRVYNRFAGQHERLLIVDVLAQYRDEVKGACECIRSRSGVVPGKDIVEAAERLDIVSRPFCVMYVDRCEQGRGAKYGESGFEVMSPRHRKWKKPKILLIVKQVRREAFPLTPDDAPLRGCAWRWG